MQNYRLCLDKNNRYRYTCVNGIKTPFYRYLFVDEVFYINEDGEKEIIDDAIKFSSKVIWYQG